MTVGLYRFHFTSVTARRVHYDYYGNFLRPYGSQQMFLTFHTSFVLNDLRIHLILIILL